MAWTENLYSRFVAWSKILLPIAALALLASLFLVGRSDRSGDAAIPFADVNLEELARDQGIADPHYTGVTEDGREISLQAERAKPKATDRGVVDAEDLTAVLETGENGTIRLRASSGTVDTGRATAHLAGGVTVITATGHELRTDAMRTALDRADMASDGPATLTGPHLRAEGGKLVVRPSTTNPDDVIVVFKQGVKLVYAPATD